MILERVLFTANYTQITQVRAAIRTSKWGTLAVEEYALWLFPIEILQEIFHITYK